MPFPLDPNAPGGPRRSEYVRSSVAVGAPLLDGRRGQGVSIQISTLEDEDRESVRRLASLAEGPAPTAPVVLAKVNGAPVAALSLTDGATVADRSRLISGTLAVLRRHRLEAWLIGAIWRV